MGRWRLLHCRFRSALVVPHIAQPSPDTWPEATKTHVFDDHILGIGISRNRKETVASTNRVCPGSLPIALSILLSYQLILENNPGTLPQ